MRTSKQLINKALFNLGYEVRRLNREGTGDVPGYKGFTEKESHSYQAIGNLGELSIDECRSLGELVRKSDSQRPIIEVGTLFGFSTIVITIFKQQSQELITVDNYSWNPLGISPDAHYGITRNRLSDVIDRHNVRLLRMDKDEFYRTYQGPPPAIFFCDADHSYAATKTDLLWARSIGASIICGDDYNLPHESGVKEAVDEMGGPSQLTDGFFVL
jgi:hypothetical protein